VVEERRGDREGKRREANVEKEKCLFWNGRRGLEGVEAGALRGGEGTLPFVAKHRLQQAPHHQCLVYSSISSIFCCSASCCYS
jgi:hypothetical protein